MDHRELSVVLFSGGWESTYCAARAVERHGPKSVVLVCILYGQSYWRQERDAAFAISAQLGHVPLRFYHHDALARASDTSRVVPDRNEKLLSAALHSVARDYDTLPTRVYIGTRGLLRVLDPYKDSNLQWARQMSRKYGVRVLAPCTLRTKRWVRQQVLRRGIAESMVFSSEGLMS